MGKFIRSKNLTTMESINKHRLKSIWRGMMYRCYGKSHECYKDYGGRGIVVCDRWHVYNNFYDDLIVSYKKELSMDRIDNDGNYEINNIRWATKREQSLNRRTNHIIECRGIIATFIEFSDMSGIKPTAIYNRLARGWTMEDAIFVPKQRGGKISIYTKKLEAKPK